MLGLSRVERDRYIADSEHDDRGYIEMTRQILVHNVPHFDQYQHCPWMDNY